MAAGQFSPTPSVHRDEGGLLASDCCNASLPTEMEDGEAVATCGECGRVLGPARALLGI